MEIETIHIEPLDEKKSSPGSGWVRKTWENGMLEEAKIKIMRLISAEKDVCPALKEPIVRIGDPETELLRELQIKDYDLFVIGLIHSFSARQFYKRMKSKFYQASSCPILVVKNLSSINRVAILIQPDDDTKLQAETFLMLFQNAAIAVDIVTCMFHRKVALKRKHLDESPGEKDRAGSSIVNRLEEAGFSPDIIALKGDAASIGDRLSDYPLVLTAPPPVTEKNPPLLECLSRISSAILFCRK